MEEDEAAAMKRIERGEDIDGGHEDEEDDYADDRYSDDNNARGPAAAGALGTQNHHEDVDDKDSSASAGLGGLRDIDELGATTGKKAGEDDDNYSDEEEF